MDGIQLDFNTLGIINGIIDESIQAPYYPEFARHNTYGIEAVIISTTEIRNKNTLLTWYIR